MEYVPDRGAERDSTARLLEPIFGKQAPHRPETPFFRRLSPIRTDFEGEGHTIDSREGRFVGWFGIVRSVEIDEKTDCTILTVEHKYFNGKTDDFPRMTVSFNGSGDFRAVLNGTRHAIPYLTLVRVYGKVVLVAKGESPAVEAEFVKVWHWGSFAFSHVAYWEQQGSEKWRRLNQRGLKDRLYEAWPDTPYYHEVLGHQPVFDNFRKVLLSAAGDIPADSQPVISELVESLRYGNVSTVSRMLKLLKEDHAERAAEALLAEALRSDDKTAHAAAAKGKEILEAK